MARMRCIVAVLGLLLALPWMGVSGQQALAATPASLLRRSAAPGPGRLTPPRTAAALPLAFEPNRGQTDRAVRYLAHGPGYTLFLTDRGAVISLTGQSSSRRRGNTRELPASVTAPATRAVLGLIPQAASGHPRITVSDPLPGRVSYIIGRHASRWHTNIPTYARVTYHNLYPGIDLVFHGQAGAPEYDWLVHPGGNPAQISLQVVGARKLALNRQGQLSISTPVGRLMQAAPRLLQRGRGIAGRFHLIAGNVVRVRVGRFDRRAPLIIDPPIKLAYSTYLGGSGDDSGTAIALDPSNNAYVTGLTASPNFPVCGTYPKCTSPGTAIQPSFRDGEWDAFVSKLNPTGTQLLYSTYLGGSGLDDGLGIAVDAIGDAYLVGITRSPDFPVCGSYPKCTSPGTAIQPSFGGGQEDGYVSKLNPTGTQLLYSTYLGGSASDEAIAITVDPATGSAFVAGDTGSTNFPVCGAYPKCLTPGTAVQPSFGGGFSDVFVSKISPAGTQFVYSTYLGGLAADQAGGIAIDRLGDAFVAGGTASGDFPVCGTNPKCVTPGTAIQPFDSLSYDAFITKLGPAGATLLYSTFLGGSGSDFANGIAVDLSGDAYVTGATSSPAIPGPPASSFPVCGTYPKCAAPGTAIQPFYGGGLDDAFVSKLNPTGTQLLYSTYLGGSDDDQGHGIVVDDSGDAFITGSTRSSNFPVCGTHPRCATPNTAFQPSNAGSADAFVTALNPAGTQMVYSTYLGGSAWDGGLGIAVDTLGNAYVAGSTASLDFPTCPGTTPDCVAPGTALQPSYGGGSPFVVNGGDAFVARITSTTQTTITISPQPITCTTGFSCTRVVATFTAGSGAPCSAFAATIDWGDGALTAGSISGDSSASGCTITGTHTYLAAGTYTLTIQVVGPAAPPTSATTTATVSSFIPPTSNSTPFTTIIAGNSALSCPSSNNLVIALGVHVGATGGISGTFSFQDLSRGIRFSTADGFRILTVLRLGNRPTDGSGNSAVIFGSVVQGGTTVLVRIDLIDGSLGGCAVSNPRDTFRLQTSAGYDTGQVQIAQVSITTP